MIVITKLHNIQLTICILLITKYENDNCNIITIWNISYVITFTDKIYDDISTIMIF